MITDSSLPQLTIKLMLGPISMTDTISFQVVFILPNLPYILKLWRNLCKVEQYQPSPISLLTRMSDARNLGTRKFRETVKWSVSWRKSSQKQNAKILRYDFTILTFTRQLLTRWDLKEIVLVQKVTPQCSQTTAPSKHSEQQSPKANRLNFQKIPLLWLKCDLKA